MTSDLGLKKGILVLFITNIINMFFKVFFNFVQPKFLSIETYATLQTFTLYVSYAGLLHLGYVDGMYLKYGGKSLDQDNIISINKNIKTLRGMQLLITVITLIASLINHNQIFIFVALSIMPINITAYFRMLFQATGEFQKYGRVLNLNTLLLFAGNVLLIFIIKTDVANDYLLMELLVYIVIWILLEFKFYKYFPNKSWFAFDKVELVANIKEGLPLTLGNLASTLFASMDRWFVKFLLPTIDFAHYSFAVTIEAFLNIAITPVTITLYNYFCTERSNKEIKKLRNLVVIFSVFIVSAAFPARFILEHFIPEYIASSEILFILFAAKVFSIIIQGVFVNLYKSGRRQRVYFKKLIGCIVVGLITNIIGYLIYPHNISFAVATLITIFIWFIICMCDFKDYALGFKELIFTVSGALMLLVFGYAMQALVGFIIYILVMTILAHILLRDDFIYFINMFIGRLKKSKF